VPLIRTLRAASESVVLVTRLCIFDEENLMEEMMEEVPMRRALEYLSRELIGTINGASILSTAFPQNLILDSVLCRSEIEIDTCISVHPKLNLEVVVEL
jgi:hypothetical protein